MISTNTIVLQHQLIDDINRLVDLLHVDIDPSSIALAKGGRTNFLCPAKADKPGGFCLDQNYGSGSIVLSLAIEMKHHRVQIKYGSQFALMGQVIVANVIKETSAATRNNAVDGGWCSYCGN